MMSSHVEDISKQDQGRDLGPPTQGRKDKSLDAISIFEGHISKLELGIADRKGDVDLLKHTLRRP